MTLLMALLAGFTFSFVFLVGSSIAAYWLKQWGIVEDDEAKTRWIMGILFGLGVIILPMLDNETSHPLSWSIWILSVICLALLFSSLYFAKYHVWKAVELGRWWWLKTPEELELARKTNRKRYYGSLAAFMLVFLSIMAGIYAWQEWGK